MKRILFLILFIIPIVGKPQAGLIVDKSDIFTYTNWISGDFSSYEQSQMDSTFDDVYIHNVKFRSDSRGNWVYTEQGERVDGIPYRQRVYIVSVASDTTLIVDTYKIKTQNFYSSKNESVFFGGPNLYEKLNLLEFDDLEKMVGCSTYIHKRIDDNGDVVYYYGSTNENDCKGTFRGATYTTSEFRVFKTEIISWERGWNDDGMQVWGSETGPYIYTKIQK